MEEELGDPARSPGVGQFADLAGLVLVVKAATLGGAAELRSGLSRSFIVSVSQGLLVIGGSGY